jgi:hypothetical protein
MAQRAPNVEALRAEYAMPQPVDALVYGCGVFLGACRGTHPLQLGHVDLPSRIQGRLDHSMVAARSEDRPALAEHGSVTARPVESLPAKRVGQLMTFSQHRTVLSRCLLQCVE